MTKKQDARDAFAALTATIAKLRDPDGGCPWDLKQTHETLKPYLIEESYELLDAIDAGPQALKEELGDVLLQVMLHSQIATDNKQFSITDVVTGLNEKLIARHPHVFGDSSCETAEDVTRSWEQSKQRENRSLLAGIPRSMPALQQAQLIGERTERVGFDWDSPAEVASKIEEELQEFLDATNNGETQERVEEEFGDLLFTLAQLGRKAELPCETILQKACDKFKKRFELLERKAARPLGELSRSELESLWQQIKK